MKKLIVLCLALIVGCERYHEEEGNWGGGNSSGMRTTFVFDISPSFIEKMADNGNAFRFLMAAMEAYFKDQMDGQIIIAQISGGKKTFLFEGTQKRLRQLYPTAKEFGEFLRKHAEPDGSMVNDSIAGVLNYITLSTEFAQGQKEVVLVLSDLVDTGSKTTDREVKELVQEFVKKGGVIGLHYISEKEFPAWRAEQRKSGSKWYYVGHEQLDQPAVPHWD
jgi:hypothetical protein